MLRTEKFWHYAQWAAKAHTARGEKAEAIRYAESCRGQSTPDTAVDRVCEEILLSSDFAEEAYERYGRGANRRGTYLATLRAISKKYPHKQPSEILADLAADTPGEEGKWFAAAKDARLYDLALDFARRSPCDPRTLARAARDFAERLPAFGAEAGVLSLHWIAEGHGYEVTGREVLDVFSDIMRAAEASGTTAETSQRLRDLVARDAPDGAVWRVLGRVLTIDESQPTLARRAGRSALDWDLAEANGGTLMSNFRIVSATNEDVAALASVPRFRADLLHRPGEWCSRCTGPRVHRATATHEAASGISKRPARRRSEMSPSARYLVGKAGDEVSLVARIARGALRAPARAPRRAAARLENVSVPSAVGSTPPEGP